MTSAGWALLGASLPAGAALGAGWAGVARRIPDPEQPLFRPPCAPVLWTARIRGTIGNGWDPAPIAGAAVPAAAFLVAPDPGAALAAAAVGWLLLGIAVCDERTLAIPHVLWALGIVLGLAVAWCAGGWSVVAARTAAALILECVLFAGAALARWIAGRTSLGASDYGVVAFLGAVFGFGCTVDVLLAAGVVALAVVAVRACGREGRASEPVPLGACLAAGAFLVILGSTVPSLPASEALRHDVVLQHLRPNLP